MRSNSTRSGPSFSRSRSTATLTTRSTASTETGGTTWRRSLRVGWCRPSCPGGRDAEAVEEEVGEVKGRTGGRVLDLATIDDYSAYEMALLNAYGQEVATTATGPLACRMVPAKVPPGGMN